MNLKKVSAVLLAGAVMCQAGLSFAVPTIDLNERENNDRDWKADTYWSAKEDRIVISGTVDQDDTTDWFKFKAYDDGNMYIKFRYDEGVASSDLNLSVYIIDEDGDVIRDYTNNGDISYKIRNISRKDYLYVKVVHGSGELNQKYKLKTYMR